MLRREALKQLEKWVNNKLFYAAIVFGARQVGKTFLVREFANIYGSIICLRSKNILKTL